MGLLGVLGDGLDDKLPTRVGGGMAKSATLHTSSLAIQDRKEQIGKGQPWGRTLPQQFHQIVQHLVIATLDTVGNLLSRNGAVAWIVSCSSIVDGEAIGMLNSAKGGNLAHPDRLNRIAQILAEDRLEWIAGTEIVGAVLVEIEQAVSGQAPFPNRREHPKYDPL